VDAGPADAALRHAQGAIALRRARLERLLEEAQAQGAAPSSADLAHALGVSRRTVQRDLAALRRAA
jgi:predicted DNA-binding transcriptional regulator YafY